MMNRSFAKYILVLLALYGHMLFGQHDMSSQLVLCFGEDGHIALETLQHEPHEAMLMAKQAWDSVHCLGCPIEEDCQDITISFSHDELYDTQKSPRFIGTVAKTRVAIQPYYIQQTILPLAPPEQTARPPNIESTQTLKNTILLI